MRRIILAKKSLEETGAVICSAGVQGCTRGVGVSVVLHVGPTMLVTVVIKSLCDADLAVLGSCMYRSQC